MPPTPATTAPALTVLSLGGGQDSTALAYRLRCDPDFRRRWAPGRLLTIFVDTLDEHDETYSHLDYLQEFYDEWGEEFVRITPGQGYHTGDWTGGLLGFYRAKSAIGSKCYPKTCTDRLKIQPFYRYLAARLACEHALPATHPVWKGKGPLVEFARRFGRVRVLIGFARGEESRVSSDDAMRPWMRQSVERSFPLIDLGWDRSDCVSYMRREGLPVPPPSQCRHCPFKSERELLWTARRYPAVYSEWVDLEAQKLQKWGHLEPDRNLGVFGRRPLPVVLADAAERYKDMSDADLDEYRMTHGHCIRSAF